MEEYCDTSIEHILPMLRYAYAAFLKIHEIRSRGHLKGRAIKNIVEFSDWCECFECHVPIIFQAAFALFGGCKDAQTILTVKKNKTPLDAAWGAAWDTWYVWMIQSYLPTQLVDGVSQRSIFVTDDAAAAFIAGKCTPRASFLNHGQPLLSASELSLDFPYYFDRMELLKSILKKNLHNQMSRITSNLGAEKNWDEDKVCEEINRLEYVVTLDS
ncbi:hypothetical protein [Undibacterium sp. Ji22W]|uniref:hypothetical protein n=1 Tax=Undibacterium sp. Ji22W TaxID=3413038 RepID=UPI003BF225F2